MYIAKVQAGTTVIELWEEIFQKQYKSTFRLRPRPMRAFI
jgi:hypothetical protein